MTSKSQENYSDEQKSVMKQLKNSPRRLQLYKIHMATTTSKDLLRAVDSISILEFNMNSVNLMTPAKDKMTMEDLRCLQRNLPGEDTIKIGRGSIQWLIWRIAVNQHLTLQKETAVFTLNTCKIDVSREGSGGYADLTKVFRTQWNKFQTQNLFVKQIVLFPVMSEDEVYLTMVENPMGVFKEKHGTCRMVHFGTGDMEEYRTTIGFKIQKLVELFAKFSGLTAENEYNETSIEVIDQQFPRVPDVDKPFLMLYFMNRILTTASEIPDWRKVILEFNTKQKQLERDLVNHRRRLCAEVLNAVEMRGTRAAKMLVAQRERIVEFQARLARAASWSPEL